MANQDRPYTELGEAVAGGRMQVRVQLDGDGVAAIFCEGDPNGALSGVRGQLAIDQATGDTWQNADDGTTWVPYTPGGGGGLITAVDAAWFEVAAGVLKLKDAPLNVAGLVSAGAVQTETEFGFVAGVIPGTTNLLLSAFADGTTPAMGFAAGSGRVLVAGDDGVDVSSSAGDISLETSATGNVALSALGSGAVTLATTGGNIVASAAGDIGLIATGVVNVTADELNVAAVLDVDTTEVHIDSTGAAGISIQAAGVGTLALAQQGTGAITLATAAGSISLAATGNLGLNCTGTLTLKGTTVTAAGLALLDDADAAAQRTTLGATSVGSSVFTAASAAAARTAIGAGATGSSLITATTAAQACNTLGLGLINTPQFAGLNTTGQINASGATSDIIAGRNVVVVNSIGVGSTASPGTDGEGDFAGQVRALSFRAGGGLAVIQSDGYIGGQRLYVAGDVGFFGTSPTGKPTVTGSKGGNAALASLLTALAGLGLVTDSTT